MNCQDPLEDFIVGEGKDARLLDPLADYTVTTHPPLCGQAPPEEEE